MLTVALSGASCKSRKAVTSETNREQYQAHNESKVKRDSVYIYERDSVLIRERGDTVYVEKWRTRYAYLSKVDTVVRADSVYIDRAEIVTNTVEIEVEKKLAWWQTTLMWCGVVFLLIVLYAFYKPFKK